MPRHQCAHSSNIHIYMQENTHLWVQRHAGIFRESIWLCIMGLPRFKDVATHGDRQATPLWFERVQLLLCAHAFAVTVKGTGSGLAGAQREWWGVGSWELLVVSTETVLFGKMQSIGLQGNRGVTRQMDELQEVTLWTGRARVPYQKEQLRLHPLGFSTHLTRTIGDTNNSWHIEIFRCIVSTFSCCWKPWLLVSFTPSGSLPYFLLVPFWLPQTHTHIT